MLDHTLIELFRTTHTSIYIIDIETYEIVYVNPAAYTLYGDFLTSKQCFEILQNLKTPCPFCILDHHALSPNQHYVWQFQTPKGIHCQAHELIFHNSSERRFKIQFAHSIEQIGKEYASLEYLTFYDELTGLPNRKLLERHLDQTLQSYTYTANTYALLLIDIDEFKRINNTKGHRVGDLYLIEIAKRLSSTLRQSDFIARFGGDEFMILLSFSDHSGKDSKKIVEGIAHKLIEHLQASFNIDDEIKYLNASIGIVMINTPQPDTTRLLKEVEISMYAAKNKGKNRIEFFNATQQDEIEYQSQLYNRLINAIEKHHFELYFQPIYDLNTHITGAEALIRWMDNGTLIAPDVFISFAEANNLIKPISHWVIRRGFETLQQWSSQPERSHLTLSLNFSPKQFDERRLSETLLTSATHYNVKPQKLVIEITEGVLMHNSETTLHIMHDLVTNGFRFALDDFGTGYSSLSYLKRYPISILKIDKSFIRDMLDDPTDVTIVQAIIQIAKTMQMHIVAEGVEYSEQHAQLVEWGCDLFQGYYFSKPLKLENFEAL